MLEEKQLIKGISVCNPVDVDKEYLLSVIDYAAAHNLNHLQIIGPIHDYTKGNIDGMTLYRKYSQFNTEKDTDYILQSLDIFNAISSKIEKSRIKTYVWHHELYLPAEFKETYPETLNDYGDIEISHPRIKDFLENKISDFFFSYPDVNGIILTLHETSIPLLKLKNQKLNEFDRIKYITKIIYDTCNALKKELIVRPFASIEEDYNIMAKAYEEISSNLIIMDKWTQFDWSLTMPNNPFLQKIQGNPLLVEGDIFGEFFGKGRLPLMLYRHIKDKFLYCNGLNPAGYVARIDRNGQIPFRDVNEINLIITASFLNNTDPEIAINQFFETKYPHAAAEIRDLMEKTEEIVAKTFYLKGYLFSELSIFPSLNHCKNHYYFELMRSNYVIDSNEWYIPHNWHRDSVDDLLAEKQNAVVMAEDLLNRIIELKERISQSEYKKLWIKFCNLKYVTKIWYLLTLVHINYIRYFESYDLTQIKDFEDTLHSLSLCNEEGKKLLGNQFYCMNGNTGQYDFIQAFIEEIRESFYLEKESMDCISKESNLLDYIICGGATEGHLLQKEVNFSDTQIYKKELCRIPGNRNGNKWSSINAHGWFSYQLSVKPNCQNLIQIRMSSMDPSLDVSITIGEQTFILHEKIHEKQDFTFSWTETKGQNFVRIRFDKISTHVPCIHTIKSFL